MDKLSNRSSVVDEQYEEQISGLRTKINSQQYQINDLKSFIKNQKTIHSKELEQLKAMNETLVQNTCAKYQNEISNLSLEIESLRQKYNIEKSKQTTVEVINLIQIELSLMMKQFAERVYNKLDLICQRFHLFEKRTTERLTTLANVDYERAMKLISLSKDADDKRKLLERQKKFVERIVQEKQDSDQMYEKQLNFLDQVYQQRREMCHHLEKVNVDLQNENSSLRSEISSNSRFKSESIQIAHPHIYTNTKEEYIDSKRPTKIVMISQPTDIRATPKGNNKSCLKGEREHLISSQASPLRTEKINQNMTANSPQYLHHRPQKLALSSLKNQSNNFSKRNLAKTIEVYSQNYKTSKGKENFEKMM